MHATFDLTTLPGTSLSDVPYQRWREFCEERPLVPEREVAEAEEYYLQFFHAGVSLLVDAADVILTVQVYLENREGFTPYAHELPMGATAVMNRQEVRELLCPPSEAGGPVQSLTGPERYCWDRWEFSEFHVQFQYTEDARTIRGVTISYPAPVAEVEPEESEGYALPTMDDALPATERIRPSAQDLMLREEEWRQFEVVSREWHEEIEQEFADIRAIRAAQEDEEARYAEVHWRRRIPRPLEGLSWSGLLEAAGVSVRAVQGLGLHESGELIADGFSFEVGRLTFYGVRRRDAVQVLGLELNSAPAVAEETARALAALLEKHNLILVYWPSASAVGGKNAVADYLRQKPRRSPRGEVG